MKRTDLGRTAWRGTAALLVAAGISTAVSAAWPVATAAQAPCAVASPGAATPAAAASGGTVVPTQAPAAPEQNLPGDIPDNQAFVVYQSTAGGYAVEMPEGWARQESGPNVTFTDKIHQFSVEIGCAGAAPTADSAKTADVPQLAQRVPAFELVEIKAVTLPAGPAVLIRYRMNSAPDDVTGKQIRLDVDRYEVFKDGKLAAISLAAPTGSDNVDVSKRVAESFKWTA